MAGKASVLVDLQKLELIAGQYGIGTQEELARRLGINRGTLYRARETGRVGEAFIARTLAKLPVKFDEVFSVQVEDQDYSALDGAVKIAA